MAAKDAGLAARSLTTAAAAEVAPATGPVTLQEHIKPVLEKYCFDCHNDKKQKGDVNLLSVAGNPKLEMAMRERPTESLKPSYPDPAGFVDDEVVFRDFCCPGCGVRLATETAYPGAAPFHELQLD